MEKGSSTSPTSLPPLNSPLPLFPAHCKHLSLLDPSLRHHKKMGGSVFATNAPPGTPQCPIRGCGQTRIAPDCHRRFCRKHCISNGDCTSETHTGSRSALPPVAVVQPFAFLPRRFYYSSTTASAYDGQILRTASPSNTNTSPVRISPDADVLDALPSARFRSHMPPILTSQWKKEQELAEEQRRMDAEGKLCAAQVKHTVVVYLWAESSKPATGGMLRGTICVYLALLPPFHLCLERIISHWLFDACSALPPGSRYLG